jgi:hypothetical protein
MRELGQKSFITLAHVTLIYYTAIIVTYIARGIIYYRKMIIALVGKLFRFRFNRFSYQLLTSTKT